MAAYSKLIAAVVGNLIAIGLVYLSTKGFGTCDAAGNCTVLGFTTAQLQGAAVLVVSSLFVHQAPANQQVTK